MSVCWLSVSDHISEVIVVTEMGDCCKVKLVTYPQCNWQ